MSVSSLERLGVRPGHDAQHRNLANASQFEAERYFDEARTLLTRVAPVVLDEVVPVLEDFAGRWNPGGFMVFPLGLTGDGSSLRLHVYAANMPRNVLNGPFIHNHGWHLAARVLAGNYEDTIYGLERKPNATVDPDQGVLRLYETRRNPNGHDELVTDGTIVKATPTEDRNVPAGGFHTIKAVDVYHKPTTPSEHLAATLVLDSPAFSGVTHVLLDNSQGGTVQRQRRPLEPKSIALAKEQLRGITRL